MIKNYTSTIPAERSIMIIEQKLAAAGAEGIMKLYDHKKPTAVIFKVMGHAFRLPANVEACEKALWKDYVSSTKRPRDDAKARIREQAERTAWKIVSDWIILQISMIELQQLEPMEAFFQFAWDGKQTLFEAYKSNGFKQLTAGQGGQ